MNQNEHVECQDGKEDEKDEDPSRKEISCQIKSESSFPQKHNVTFMLTDSEKRNEPRSGGKIQFIKTDVNPGVGLKMTSTRSEITRPSLTPCPQSYDVSFKLSEQEKRQNKLLSERYL